MNDIVNRLEDRLALNNRHDDRQLLLDALSEIGRLKSGGVWAQERFLALQDAFRNWPAMPHPLVLTHLRGKWPEDHERGTKIQEELGRVAIPSVSECEGGAGFWDRITQGAWREAHKKNGPDSYVTDEPATNA